MGFIHFQTNDKNDLLGYATKEICVAFKDNLWQNAFWSFAVFVVMRKTFFFVSDNHQLTNFINRHFPPQLRNSINNFSALVVEFIKVQSTDLRELESRVVWGWEKGRKKIIKIVSMTSRNINIIELLHLMTHSILSPIQASRLKLLTRFVYALWLSLLHQVPI